MTAQPIPDLRDTIPTPPPPPSPEHPLRRRRREHGWSQADLAFHAGLTPSAVYQIEAGRTRPDLGTIARLANAFGLTTQAERDRLLYELRPDWPLIGTAERERADAAGRARHYLCPVCGYENDDRAHRCVACQRDQPTGRGG